MAALVRAATPILAIMTIASLVVALSLIGGGVALVWLHETGATEFTMFGNTFKSASVGVTGIFCGAVLGVILLRRAYNSVDKIISSPEGPARK